jgi:hypothetical protein
MKSPKPPKAPDPWAQAQAQTHANKEAAIAAATINNYDEDSPFGSVRYERIAPPGATGAGGFSGGGLRGRMGGRRMGGGRSGMLGMDVPRYKRIVTLSPEQQKLYDQQVQAGQGMNDLAISQIDRLHDHMGNPMNLDGLPEMQDTVYGANINSNWSPTGEARGYNGEIGDAGRVQGGVNLSEHRGRIADAGKIQRSVGPNDFSQDRRKVEDAIMSRYDERFAQDEQRMQSQLAAQGLVPGTAAYNKQFQELQKAKTDARMQAILAGGQEQSRLFGMDVAKGQFANAAQDQAFDQNAATAQFDMDRTGFNNNARLQSGSFRNAAQGQRYAQESDRARYGMERAGFNNAAVAQNNATSFQAWQGNNAAEIDRQNASQAAGSFRNQARSQSLQERLATRNQPINEIAALLNGGEVSVPQFSGPYQQGISPVPIGDYIQQNFANKMAGYQSKLQSRNAMMGGMFSLAAAPFGMFSFGGGR